MGKGNLIDIHCKHFSKVLEHIYKLTKVVINQCTVKPA